MGCLLAKNEFKVKRVIGAVRNPRNRWLYNRSWGVDVALDAAQIVARIIEEEATLTDLVRLLDLREGEVTLTAITATADGHLAGKTFAELGTPEGCHPVALLRGNDVVMPGEGVRIQVDDALLVLAGPGGSCKIDTYRLSIRRGGPPRAPPPDGVSRRSGRCRRGRCSRPWRTALFG